MDTSFSSIILSHAGMVIISVVKDKNSLVFHPENLTFVTDSIERLTESRTYFKQ